MLHLLDTYAAGISLLCSALFECIAVSWFYGKRMFKSINRLCRDYRFSIKCPFRFGEILRRRGEYDRPPSRVILAIMLEIRQPVVHHSEFIKYNIRLRDIRSYFKIHTRNNSLINM